MSRFLENYRGYEIVTGSPEYGKQFAFAWRVDDESSMQFVASADEAKAEIDEYILDGGPGRDLS